MLVLHNVTKSTLIVVGKQLPTLEPRYYDLFLDLVLFLGSTEAPADL